MRDLVLLGLLPLMLVAMGNRPFIALGMWIWTAMFFPNGWVYGVASSLRYNLLFAAFAIAGYFLFSEKRPVRWGSIGFLVTAFFLWTTVTTVSTSGIPEISWDYWSRFLKVFLLFVFVVLIAQKKLHIDFFLWSLVLSIGFYAVVEGLKFIVTGGGHQIAGLAGHILGDRNDLALAFVMMLPICVYLFIEYGKESKLAKLVLVGAIIFMVLSIIGTQSRGGLIALLALVMYIFIKSNHKLPIATLMIIAAGIASTLVTEQWMSRMDTISDASNDASFMGRVVAWKLSLILAVQHPFVGGGFKTLEVLAVWQSLAQQFHTLSFFYTGDVVPNMESALAAHSIYFQVLGDHGFIGLGLYLLTLLAAFRGTNRVVKRARRMQAEPWIISMATMLRLSIFAFCLGGAALSMAYFELIFAIFGLVIVLDKKILPEEAREPYREAAPRPAPA